jgi:uncharacterized protein (DUF1684 family)
VSPAEHRASVLAWRAARDARLRDPDGWLTLIGLYWLEAGKNRLGSDPANDLVIRSRHVPAHAGVLELERGSVTLRRDGLPPEVLATDVSGEPTILRFGPIRAHVVRRGERFGLRVRDRASPALTAFAGMEHFPIDAAWRLVTRLEPAEPGSTLEVVDVTGTVSHEPTPGTLAFESGGVTWRLTALPGGDDGSFWLVFADATSGGDTYGGGRFLYTDPPAADGSVVVDFNLAYNPPCVFSPFATCPLPPAQNRLPITIRAGERRYAPHG